MNDLCPRLLQKRTCAVQLGMSAKCPRLLRFAARPEARQGQLREGYYGELDYCGIPAPPRTGHLMQYAVRLLGWLHVLHYQP